MKINFLTRIFCIKILFFVRKTKDRIRTILVTNGSGCGSGRPKNIPGCGSGSRALVSSRLKCFITGSVFQIESWFGIVQKYLTFSKYRY
jgi:hypothetical protein